MRRVHLCYVASSTTSATIPTTPDDIAGHEEQRSEAYQQSVRQRDLYMTHHLGCAGSSSTFIYFSFCFSCLLGAFIYCSYNMCALPFFAVAMSVV